MSALLDMDMVVKIGRAAVLIAVVSLAFAFVFAKPTPTNKYEIVLGALKNNPMEAGILLIFYAAIAEFIDEGFLK